MKKSHIYLVIITLIIATGAFLFIASDAEAGSAMAPQVKVYNTQDQHIDLDFYSFSRGFGGGGYAAVGDTNGNGNDEILIGAGFGGGPQIMSFDKSGHFTGLGFFPFHPDFRGGVSVAAGDVDGDGVDEIICGQAMDGQAWVKVYKTDKDRTVLAEFLAYPASFQGGVFVAAGDIDGDGQDEVITGSGMGSYGHVRAFDGEGNYLGWDVRPFDQSHKGGVSVAVGNVDGGLEEEVIVSAAAFGSSRVKVYKTGADKRIVGDFLAYPEGYKEGAYVTAGDVDNDGIDEVVTGTAGGGPHVRAFEAWGYPKTLSFLPYSSDFRGGVRVAIGNIDGGDVEELVTMPGRKVIEGRTDIYKYIEVNITEQRLTAYEKGRKVRSFLISSGTGKYPTPVGHFTVYRKALRERMNYEYGPDHPDNYDLDNVPHVLAFSGGYTIHGAYWHNNFGHQMSHGCVNEPLGEAAWLYGWAGIGTDVFIHY